MFFWLSGLDLGETLPGIKAKYNSIIYEYNCFVATLRIWSYSTSVDKLGLDAETFDFYDILHMASAQQINVWKLPDYKGLANLITLYFSILINH